MLGGLRPVFVDVKRRLDGVQSQMETHEAPVGQQSSQTQVVAIGDSNLDSNKSAQFVYQFNQSYGATSLPGQTHNSPRL